MKTLILILLTVLCSCSKGQKHPKEIVNKYYLTWEEESLPTGICRYWYTEYDNVEAQEFMDSCNKYNIGDTIK